MKCRKCGREAYISKICHTCLKKWEETRMKAFSQAQDELGKLCPENHKEINKRIKEIERSSSS